MLNDNISKLRKRNGYTQVEFAKKLHVTQSAVSHWESGRSVPDTLQLFNIAQLFGMTVDELTNEVPQAKPAVIEPPAPVQAQEKAPGSLDDQIMKELEGFDTEQLREVLNFIRFRKQGVK